MSASKPHFGPLLPGLRKTLPERLPVVPILGNPVGAFPVQPRLYRKGKLEGKF